MKMNDCKYLVELFAQNNINIPIMLVGSMGVGKSWVFKDAASDLDRQYIDLRLSQMEAGDITGIPTKGTGDMAGRTVWLKPEWWPKEGTKGILVLEELNRAGTDTRQAIFQLLNERKINTHVLPDGWTIGIAINPEGEAGYQVESLDKAMYRRCLVIAAKPDVRVWKKWARDGKKIDSKLMDFLDAQPELLYKEESFDIPATYTPDSYRMLTDIVSAIPDFYNKLSQGIQQEIFTGLLGKEAGTALRKYIQDSRKPVTPAELLEGTSEQYTCAFDRYNRQSQDMNARTVKDVLEYLNTGKITTKQKGTNFCQFALDVKPEFQGKLISESSDDVLEKVVKDKFSDKDKKRFVKLLDLVEKLDKELQKEYEKEAKKK